jgi:hypothetical protein
MPYKIYGGAHPFSLLITLHISHSIFDTQTTAIRLVSLDGNKVMPALV